MFFFFDKKVTHTYSHDSGQWVIKMKSQGEKTCNTDQVLMCLRSFLHRKIFLLWIESEFVFVFALLGSLYNQSRTGLITN